MRLRPSKIAPEHASSVAAARETLNAALGRPTAPAERDELYAQYAATLAAAGLPQPPDWRDWPPDTTRRPPAEPRREPKEGSTP